MNYKQQFLGVLLNSMFKALTFVVHKREEAPV